MSERRDSERLDVHLTARYDSDAVTLSGWVANLSCHGMFLRSEFLDTTGALANLDVRLPGDVAPISLAGEVVRVVEETGCSGMGIRFQGVDPVAMQRLTSFIATM